MKRRQFLKQSSTAGLVALVTPAGVVQFSNPVPSNTPLADRFLNPPHSARPQTWWHWMNGNVSREGITLDLEAMQQIGLGGFQNFDAGTGIPKGPVQYLSPEWLALKEHTIHEAERLGLEFTMHNCPGWSSSGGPWITPERGMQAMTWSETYLTGGQAVRTKLPRPPGNSEHYQDVAVLAFPALTGEAALTELVSKATVGAEPVDLKRLTGEDASGVAIKAGEGNSAGWLQLDMKAPYAARSLGFITTQAEAGGGGFGGPAVTIEASDDGQQFRKLTTTGVTDGFTLAEFPLINARYFRLSSTQSLRIAHVRLSGAVRLTDWRKKANYEFAGVAGSKAHEGEVPAGSVIPLSSVLNLTGQVDKDGTLTWDAPAGNWTVLRVGFTPTGTMNRSAPDTGVGLECDKYSAEAITFHFHKMMEQLLPTLAPLAKQGRVGLLIDSYEVGMQNWTPRFEQMFQQRNGYDLLRYLPAMTGRLVDSVDTTERFLWDIRRTQADLMADNYYGQLTKLCHQHGLISYTEPYDRGPMEEMQIGARVDVNMGEFWNGLSTLFQNNWTMRRTTKLAASIAHTNGQTKDGFQVVGAEAFTGEPESARWQEYPFGMKALGDKLFSQGLNRIIFHRYAHQPHPTAQPGMTMGPWGIHFDRTNTWWKPARAWIQYLSRCQSLLQQGLFVADLAYFTGEEGNAYAKVSPDDLVPSPPAGYDYDLINGETLLRRATVEDGRLMLPGRGTADGMSYRVLVLQNPKALSLPLLKKLRELVRQGLVIVGNRPERSLGLRDGANGETEFRKIVSELWGSINGTTVTENRLSNGRVCWGKPVADTLQRIAVPADCDITSRSGDAPITYIHRRVGDTDLYFLANQRRTTEEVVGTFRVAGKQPELWDADTGTMTPVGVYDVVGGQTRVPITLEPCGSVFVVFQKPITPTNRRVLEVRSGQTRLLSTRPFPAASPKRYDTADNFTISLWAKPELNIMLNTGGLLEGIAHPWTDYYALYPPSGEALYGPGHATSGLTIGRNGVAIWERTGNVPVLTLAARIPLSGWSHVAATYQNNTPSIWVNGKLVQAGKQASGAIVHPGLGPVFLGDGASFYNGDRTEPELFAEVLSSERIAQLAARPAPVQRTALVVEQGQIGTGGLLFYQNGTYALQDNTGRETALTVRGLGGPVELDGPWQVSFPPNLGAPASITLPRLVSLHTHADAGVRYFSGTATYRQSFPMPTGALSANNRLLLDLGSVEIIAELRVNGKNAGILWKRPYVADITKLIKAGTNTVEIDVTNGWPNRLIGDAQLADVDKYAPGAGGSGFASLSGGAIQELPDWYKQGKPKPADGRVTFATWKHYTADSPLLPSGLVGPVVLRTAHLKTNPLA